MKIRPFLLCASLYLMSAATPVVAVEVANVKLQPNAVEPKIYAHRGGRVWAPENTLAAFKKSVDAGVDGIELDVHRCKTGELVVIHDEKLAGTTDGVGQVGDMTLSDLRKVSAGVKFNQSFASERIPTLKEVFDLVNGKLIINIEVKNAPVGYEGIDDELISELASYPHKDKIIISSFDHEVIQRIHKKAPQYPVAMLLSGILADVSQYAKGVGAVYLNPQFGNMRKDTVDSAHAAKLGVYPWTINGKENWAEAINMGVDGIITDDPEGLKKYLSERKTGS